MNVRGRKVVITGAGAVTALGPNVNTLWEAMLAGRTGIRAIRSLELTTHRTRIGAEIDDAVWAAAFEGRPGAGADRAVELAAAAAAQALAQAAIPPAGPETPPRPIGVLVGSGGGCVNALANAYFTLKDKGPRGVRPTTVPRTMSNAISSRLSMEFKLGGTNYVTVSACTSSTVSLGIAARMIRHGDADAVLCVGTETPFEAGSFAAWDNLGVMSRRPDPLQACRPFDKDRDGCVIGEGAGALMLETEASARERGAPILASILGFGESSDTTHITRPSADGQARALRAALDSAGAAPGDVEFINAHGTATDANDSCEAESIRLAFGPATDRIPVASNKPFFGHLLGACGIVETLVTVFSLKTGVVPPNLNLDHPDPACPLRFVGSSPMTLNARIAVKANFGFGGSNAVLVLGKD
jgi:3-oxoacyl-[acyl-carrier-protein] synthase II